MYRIGLIIPSSNTTMEREFWDTLHGYATIHTGRVFLENVRVSELNELEDEAVEEARKLVTAGVNILVYGCTSGSFVRGPEQYRAIEEKLEKLGKPAVATSGAVCRALTHLGARKISLITPYTKDITEAERVFLNKHGFEVLSVFHASIVSNTDIGMVKDDEVAEWAVENTHPDSDAVFISCTNLSTFKAIKKIEEKTGKPVVSSNSATLWNLLWRLGSEIEIPHLAKLFVKKLG